MAGADDWTSPSVRLLAVRRLELSLIAAPSVAAVGIVAGLLAGWRAGLGTAAVLTILALLVEVFLRRRVRAWGYAERAGDLIVRRGVLVRRLSVVPYGRMQYVDVTAGPFERAFGLATVRMHTAAAASDARIPGLSAVEAARLRDSLAALGEARTAGL